MNNSCRWREFITWFKRECIYSGGIITNNMSEYNQGGIDLYRKIDEKIKSISKNTKDFI